MTRGDEVRGLRVEDAMMPRERVATNPRGKEPGGRRPLGAGGGAGAGGQEAAFSNRNQFDRASQLRRSKKRKKSKDSASTLPRSPAKAKTVTEIVSQEALPVRRAASLVTVTKEAGADYHTKYGNLI